MKRFRPLVAALLCLTGLVVIYWCSKIITKDADLLEFMIKRHKVNQKTFSRDHHLFPDLNNKPAETNIRKTIDSNIIDQFLPKNANPDRYLIYFCSGGCGGLADRQKGIVAGYILSLLTNRTFGINITGPCPFTRFYSPNLVDWVIEPKQVLGLSKKIYSYMSGFKFQNDIPKIDLDKYFHEDVIYFKVNIDLISAIRKHPLMGRIFPAMTYLQNPDVYSIALHILLKLAPKGARELDNIFRKQVRGRHLVCAHVRLGKNPTMADVSRKLKMEEITGLWTYLDRYKDPEKYSVFVAGDSYEVRNIATLRYPKQTVEIPGPIVHISRRNYTTVNVTTAELRAIQAEGMGKVVFEQNILQRCDTIVITRSGFNLMAMYQRNHSDHLYCLVKNQVLPCVRELVFNIFNLF